MDDQGGDRGSTLRPYVPRVQLQWLAEHPDRTFLELDGSVVFVDISGFTKLSERLARRGKEGAEQVTDTIGGCFAELLAVAYANGGSLLKFGGDALLLLFWGELHAARACRAAVLMRRMLRDVGRIELPGAKVTLRMSVGINSGRFHFFLVGGSHRELLVTGPAATTTVLMEQTAEAGEIVVSPETASLLPARALGAAKGPGVLLQREPPICPAPYEPDVEVPDEDILVGLPVALREHVGSGAIGSEHRPVTVAFVHYDGTDELIRDEGPEAAAVALDELVRDVQRAVDDHGVCFLASDVDADGGKIILTAGAPRVLGEDEERMLLALRRIVEAERRLPVRVGANRGAVFAGDVGPPYRRTYTVMGDPVNLAARLMAAAEPGRILATREVLEGTRTRFEALPVPPFHVKGKAKPVEALDVRHVVAGGPDGETHELPLIGRDDELAQIAEALQACRGRRGSAIEVVGAPGIGKSRLVHEALAGAGDLAVLAATSELYTSSTPYAPFRRILRDLLGIADGTSDTDAARRLRERVQANAPHLVPWLPLLGIPLDLEIPNTPETLALDDRFVRDRVHEVLLEFLGWILPTPTAFVFEDVQWMDEASRDLLRSLVAGATVHPWVVIITRREGSGDLALPEGVGVRVLGLGALPLEAAVDLVQVATEDAPLAHHLVQALAARSEGNPLFLRELLVAVRGAGEIETLPDSVEALMTARIDRLSPGDRTLLRHASVLGTAFSMQLLATVLDGSTPANEDPTWQRLGEFLALEDGGTIRFRQTLVRDVAYEGLPYRRRMELHGRVGEEILRTVEFPQDESERLSLHFFYAGRFGEAWGHSRIAGDRAAAKYANVEAARFYERAIESARRVGEVSPLELSSLFETLGDVRERAGLYREAGRAYEQAQRHCGDDRVRRARLMLKQAKIEDTTGKSSLGLRWLSRAMRVLDGLDGAEAAEQRAQLLAWYGAIRFSQGRNREAVRWSEEAIRQATAADEKDALAHALYITDWAQVEMGRPELATHMDQVLSLYGELGDIWRQGDAYNVLGIFAYWEGRWVDAIRLYERGRELQQQAGDVVGAAIGTVNIAEILTDQGKLDEAERLTREALRVFRGADYRLQVAFTLGHLGRIASRTGRHEEARRHMAEALELVRAGGDQLEEVSLLSRLGEDLVLQGDGSAALETIRRALERAEPLGGPGGHGPLLHRVRGEALMLCGDHEGAAAAFERSLEEARGRGADYELALTLQAAATLRRLRGEPPDREAEAEAEAILERLGVEWVPPVPAAPTPVG